MYIKYNKKHKLRVLEIVLNRNIGNLIYNL